VSAYTNAFSALSDPTRRAIFERMRGGPRPVGELAEGLPVSRPAVSQHLRVLLDAGLVRVTPEGARRLYQVEPKGLLALREWFDGFWDDAMTNFKAAAEAPRTDQED
jgi:DNA-binding transcriptional ArsR family regulator